MMSMFWNTASAVPSIPLVSETRWRAGRMSKLSLRSGRKKFQPRCRWRIRLCALYWVATAMRRMPEFSALDSAKSMMRDLAAEIDGGLGAAVGQFHQPAAAAARQHIGHGLTCQIGAAQSHWQHCLLRCESGAALRCHSCPASGSRMHSGRAPCSAIRYSVASGGSGDRGRGG